jgi:hypothetical protein
LIGIKKIRNSSRYFVASHEFAAQAKCRGGVM